MYVLSPRSRSTGLSTRLSLAFIFIALALVLIAAPRAQAAGTWTVSPNSTGACTAADPHCATVMDAITAAARGDTIKIDPGTFVEHINVGKNLTIVGSGMGVTILDGGYGAGCAGTAPLYKGVIVVPSSVVASISDVTLQHGCIIGNGTPILEGAGLDNHGTATLTRVLITNNTVRGPMGGGGGISNETQTGVLTLNDVIIANNTAMEAAGLDNDHHATLTNVTIFGNQAIGTGREEGRGGGIENDTLSGAIITMTNVTVFGNSAAILGGGIVNDDDGKMHMINVTVEKNTAPRGGGIVNQATADIKNSIVANNAGGNCVGGLIIQGANLANDNTCVGFTNKANINLAGVLADNGGFVPTDAVRPGSAAIDAVADCASVTTDERGQARPVDATGKGAPLCDLGAFEYNPAGARPTNTPLPAPTLAPAAAPTQAATLAATAAPTSTATTAPTTAAPADTATPSATDTPLAMVAPSAPSIPASAPSVPSSDNSMWFIGGGFAVVVLVGGLILVRRRSK